MPDLNTDETLKEGMEEAVAKALAKIAAKAVRMEVNYPGSADWREFDFGLTFGDMRALRLLSENKALKR
jgi:hypothetical protein